MTDSAACRIQVKVSEPGAPPVFIEASGSMITVGRSKDCDVVLDQTFVSGRHLAVHFGVLAEDLNSSNGTFVGGLPLKQPTLIAGRSLTLGGHALAVEFSVLDRESPMGMLGYEVQRLMALGTSSVRANVAEGAPADPSPADPSPGQAVPDFEASSADSPILAALVKSDIDGVAAPVDAGVTDTFIYQAFAFIRNAERIIATVAGDVTRRRTMHTRMPGSDESFRSVMGLLFVNGKSADARQGVEEYLTQVLDWLFASVSAYQSAAIAVVKELQEEMRPSSLMEDGEVPRHARWLRREKVALWERAQERLEGWTASHIVERLEERARGEAVKHMGQVPSREAGG